ncbi:Phenylcoumaran benzylic ether reductase IRL1 [Paramyrothecium foliicola]|nr:Phenylcoumaran benzylic ether reductase IRL1 [Paramyrothecium foliicola]
MAPPAQGRKIAFIGAGGNIGTQILPAVLAKQVHSVTAIQRPESSALFDSAVAVKRGALDDEDFLAEALKGQQVLVITLAIMALDLQPGIIRAAAKAGVEYVLPVEFGSDMNGKLVDEIPIISMKRGFRNLVEELGVSSWIGVITNPWLQYCLVNGQLGLNLTERKATLVNGGNTKFNVSSFDRVAAAVTGLLSLPDADLADYRNKPFYVTSFHITQRELLESVMRVTRTTEKDWTITHTDTESIRKEHYEAFKQGSHAAFYHIFLELHVREGHGGDFNHKVNLDQFDLGKEDLDSVVEIAVEHSKAW